MDEVHDPRQSQKIEPRDKDEEVGEGKQEVAITLQEVTVNVEEKEEEREIGAGPAEYKGEDVRVVVVEEGD